MKITKFGQNFLDTTRGRIVGLLRRGIETVDELAQKLEVTDNAVRAHLATLERDGLVKRGGERRGSRKPHFAYALTPEAEQLFPKAYSTLFNQLLAVLKQRLTPQELDDVLHQVAGSLAAGNTPGEDETVESRAQRALATFESLGGAPNLKYEGGNISINSLSSCPFDATVSAHPEVCRLAEVFLSEVTGLEVRERCQKEELPQCSFQIIIGK